MVKSALGKATGAGIRTAIGTGFGTGRSPLAPGTAGSLAALAGYYLLYHLLHRALAPALPAPDYLLAGRLPIDLLRIDLLPAGLLTGLIVIGFPVGVWATGRLATAQEPDPGRAVWDEFVGMWVTCLLLPPEVLWLAAAFCCFRFFDIVKPWPVRWLERLPGGWGIMADDLAAGLYGAILLNGVRLAWLAWG